MPGTYKFHTSPPLQASERPRHRNRTVPSAIMLDQWGCEHLYLNFWIETTASSQASLTSWAGFDDWEWTIDYISQWTRHQSKILWKKSRNLFAMLVGESSSGSLPSPTPPPPSLPTTTTQPREKKSSWFSLAGLFSSVKSSRVVAEMRKADPVTYTAGEVHVDLVRVRPSLTSDRPRAPLTIECRSLEANTLFTDIFWLTNQTLRLGVRLEYLLREPQTFVKMRA
jgi:import inner membrane translocase subunit TIM21